LENITRKYGLRVKYDQFGNLVSEDFQDINEIVLIQKFEEYVLKLKHEQRNSYSMVELGSNQAFYSLLFKAILGKDKTKNVMVEPFLPYLPRGIEHFLMNGFNGVFLQKSIGNKWGHDGGHTMRLNKGLFDTPRTNLTKLCEECEIRELDLLHCDIDSSEVVLLQEDEDFFRKKRVKTIFLLTHEEGNTTDFCKNLLMNCGYKLEFESEPFTVGGDTLLIFIK
jgi:hypothetical protein